MPPIPPSQFRALIRLRGYTLTQVARLWGISPGRLTQLADDPDRPRHWDFALWALPNQKIAASAYAHRANVIAALTTQPQREKQRQAKFDADAYWSDILQPGAVFTVATDIGDDMPEGEQGVVTRIIGEGLAAHAELQFANGHVEQFPVTYFRDPQCALWPRG